MEYTILKANHIENIIDLVNHYLEKGWSPQGGICESGTENLMFFQAMVRSK